MEQVDLLVVGAGPAGLSGAVAAARQGAQVLVVDERPAPGGSLPCQVFPTADGWRSGSERARALTAEAQAAGVNIRLGTTVWGLYAGWEVGVQSGAAPAELVKAQCVLLAAGAVQNPVALPGWTLPGVLTAGAVQVLVNQYGILPGRRALVVGSDPLSLLAAHALRWAGAELVGVVEAPAGSGAQPAVPTAALADGLPLLTGVTAVAFTGNDRVESAVLADLAPDGQSAAQNRRQVAVDLVCTGAGLSPLTELAAQAGCRLVYIDALGGWVPLHGPEQQTSVPGLYVAGSMTGVEGHEVAAAQGSIAGVAAAMQLGYLQADAATPLLAAAHAAAHAARANAPIQFGADVVEGRRQLAASWREANV